MMININRFVRNNKSIINGSLFSLFSFFNQGISFVLLIILAKFIEPSEYGQLSLFNTVVMFLGYIIALSSDGYLSVSYFRSSRESFNKDFSTVLVILMCITLFLGFVNLAAGNSLSIMLNIPLKFLWIGITIACLHVLVNINLNLFRLKENLKIYGVLSCGFALTNFVLSLFMVIVLQLNWQGRIYAQLVCMVIFSIIAFFVFGKFHLYDFSISNQRLKNVALWGIPLIPHLATTWIRQGCDRYIINSAFTLAEVGLFSFALNLSNIIEMIGHSFNSSNSVSIYKLLSRADLSNKEKIQNLKKISKDMIAIFFIATIIIIISCSLMIPIALPNYNASIPIFWILGVYGFLRCLYFVFCNYLFYWGKNNLLMTTTIAFSIIHLLLSLIFTKYSLYLTASIYLLTQLLVDFVIICISFKLIKSNLDY